MISRERPERFFWTEELEDTSGDVILASVRDYLTEYCLDFPGYESSIELIEKVRRSGFFDRMVKVERMGEHSILSHSLLVCAFALDVSRQLNRICRNALDRNIVDEPLVLTSALFHDIGNVISEEDRRILKLDEVDITRYTSPYPDDYPRRSVENNHILRGLAYFESLGFSEHAEITAHGIFHIIDDPTVPLERILLTMADLSVVKSEPPAGEWLRADFAPTLIHKIHRTAIIHPGGLRNFLLLHDRVQVFKSYLGSTGVIFPKPVREEILWIEAGIDAFTIYASLLRSADREDVGDIGSFCDWHKR